MSPEFDIRPMVEKYSALSTERLQVWQSFDEVYFSKMQRGIVFVFAAWSAPAVMGFRRFTKVLKPIDTHSADIVILDTDCLAKDSSAQLFDSPTFRAGGWGEIIWIRNGRVAALTLAHTAPDSLIEQYTRELWLVFPRGVANEPIRDEAPLHLSH